MIELKTQELQRDFAFFLNNFFQSHFIVPEHFFKNAFVFFPENAITDISEYIRLLKSFQEKGYWFLYEDKYLGKVFQHQNFLIRNEKEKINAKIIDIYEIDLNEHFHKLKNRRVGILKIHYAKSPKNPLKNFAELVYHYLYFDILTGLKIWEYNSNQNIENSQLLYKDFQRFYDQYSTNDFFELRCQFISLKSPIQEFALERIIKYLIHPIHYTNSAQQGETIQALNQILSTEDIQIIYNDTHQTVEFLKKNPLTSSLPIQNQTFALDNIANSVADFHNKIDFLWKDEPELPIFHARLNELEIVYKNNCYLATIVILGSILEGILKKYLLELEKNGYEFKDLPANVKDNSTSKPIFILNFSEMISVYEKNKGLLTNVTISLLNSYRDFRNHIHITHKDSKHFMNSDICEIGFRVLKLLLVELYEKKRAPVKSLSFE